MYFSRAVAKDKLEDHNCTITDYTRAITINPQDANFYYVRGNPKSNLEDMTGACGGKCNSEWVSPESQPRNCSEDCC